MNEKPTENVVNDLPIITKFIYSIGVLPASYKMSMTYEEQVVWLCNYLETTIIPAVNQNGEAVEELQNLYELLRTYVNDYFDNLDLQQQINVKIDQMMEDGSLTALIETYVNPYIEAQNNEIAIFKNSINNEIENINELVTSVNSGSPLVASSTSEMTDTTKVYVNTTDGKWYYYDGDSWKIGGTYQASELGNDSIYLKHLNHTLFGNLFKFDGTANYGTLVFQLRPYGSGNFTNVTSVKVKAQIYVEEANIQGTNTNLLLRTMNAYNPTSGGSYSQESLPLVTTIPMGQAKNGYVEVNAEKNNYNNISVNAIDFRWNYNSSTNPLSMKYYVKNIRVWVNDEEIDTILMTSNYSSYYGTDISPAKDFIVSNSEYTLNNDKIKDQLDEINTLVEQVEPSIEDFMNYYDNSTKSSLRSIACFGDSLTAGGGPGKAYPTFLNENINNSNVNVYNLGIGGQCSGTIAFRQGGNLLTTTTSFNIPASNLQSVEFTATPSSGNAKNFSNVNDGLKVIISGIKGTLNIISNDPDLNTLTCEFTRTESGSITSISSNTNIESQQNIHSKDVNIIWMGLNDVTFAQPYDVTGVVANYQAMVEYLQPTIKRFLIISPITTIYMTSGTSGHTHITNINNQLYALYPNNFINIENYLVTQCIYDAGITPTTDDIEKMTGGTVPPSLMESDGIHPNELTRKYIAKYIYNNMLLKGWII